MELAVSDTPTPRRSGGSIVGSSFKRHETQNDIVLDVTTRDQTFKVFCGAGQQDALWLAQVARFRYASLHPHLRPEQFVAIEVRVGDRTLFPTEKLSDNAPSGSDVIVELLGPNVGNGNFLRTKTLWEVFAYTPQSNFVKVVLQFDATGIEVQDGVGIHGNFNNWGLPFECSKLDGGDHMWEFRASFPATASIAFKFTVGHDSYTSDRYGKVGSNEEQFNYIKVRDVAPNYAHLNADVADPHEYEVALGGANDLLNLPIEDAEKMIGQAIGHYRGVPDLDEAAIRNMFLADWEKIQIYDLITIGEQADKIQIVYWRYYEQLRHAFRFFSAMGGRNIQFMNCMNFINFCYHCNIPDKKMCTVMNLDEVFRRVNIEEEFVMKEFRADGSKHYVMKDDPLNPDNQFIRAEFMESLCRIAVLKYKSISPDQALIRLLEELVLKHAFLPGVENFRKQLTEPAVQSVYSAYSKNIYKTFNQYAKAKTIGASAVISVQQFEHMLMDFQLIGDGLSVRKALHAFAMAQKEEINHEDEALLYEMTYAEYLEAWGRIADAMLEDEKVPMQKKLQILFDRIWPSGGVQRQQKQERVDYVSTFKSKTGHLSNS